jgi:hypothetical protein
LRVKSDFKHRP